MSEAPAPAQDRRGWQAVAAVVAASLALHALLLGALALRSVRGDPPPAQAFELTTLEPVEDLPALTPDPGGGAAPAPALTPAPGEPAAAEAPAAPAPPPPAPAELLAAADASAAAAPPAADVDPALALAAAFAAGDTPDPAADPGEAAPAPGVVTGSGPGDAGSLGEFGSRGLDVVFVIDATASMSEELGQVQRRALDICRVIVGVLGNPAEAVPDEPPTRRVAVAPLPPVRFGLVAFKDYGDDYGLNPTRHAPLDPDPAKLEGFLREVFAGGGGDEPEPVHVALDVATDAKRWAGSVAATT